VAANGNRSGFLANAHMNEAGYFTGGKHLRQFFFRPSNAQHLRVKTNQLFLINLPHVSSPFKVQKK